MVRSERRMGAAALLTTPLAKVSFNGWLRVASALVLLTFTALSIYQSAMAFRCDATQYVGSTSALEDGVPNLNPSPPPKEPETTKKLEEMVKKLEEKVKELEEKAKVYAPQKKPDVTKSSAEKVEVSKPLSSPTEKEAGSSNTIDSESKGKQRRDATSTFIADTKSDAGATLASALEFVPASAPMSNLSPNPGRVFWCGYKTLFLDLQFNLVKVLFPGVPAAVFEVDTSEVGPNDLLVLTRSGNCRMGKGVKYVQDAFPGKIMYVVGEVDGPAPIHERVYSLGPLADSTKTIRAYFGAMVLGLGSPETQRKIFDPQFRVNNTKKKFVAYIASNCVEFREETFRNLSTIATVHYGGGCSGLKEGMINENIQQSRVGGSWLRNAKGVFQDYRFGLVMENAKSDGYITEKIVNAFLSGGTVPIWYGSKEIFDVFNKRAFIYYDIEDPQPALDRITYLEKNRTAYNEVLKEPILANGDQTIEEYFSFRDDVGGGKLKKRIRNMLGYQ